MNEAADNDRLSDQMRVFLRSYDEIQRSDLFEPDFYRERYAVERGDLVEHYLRHGRRAGIIPAASSMRRGISNATTTCEAAASIHSCISCKTAVTRDAAAGPTIDVRARLKNLQSLKSNQRHPRPNVRRSPVLRRPRWCGLPKVSTRPIIGAKIRNWTFATISPIEHYAAFGWREGRDPSADFSTKGLSSLQCRRAKLRNEFVASLYFEGPRKKIAFIAGFSVNLDPATAFRNGAATGGLGPRRRNARKSRARRRGSQLPLRVEGTSLSTTSSPASISEGRNAGRRPCFIVIPCLNEELVTVECLQSIAQAMPQSFGIEVIVADNASEDAAFAAIGKNPTIKYLRFEKNLGFGPACNAAAAKALAVSLLSEQ